MTTKATVFVRLKEGVLDPQGVTIHKALQQMGYDQFESVRSGRFFELEVKDGSGDIENTVKEVCSKLLANPVVEQFSVEYDK
jgi:phosphoribosylformylglycinamidine synthase PurS subunit